LYWYIAGTPEGGIKEVVDWVLSPEGQMIVTDVDFYPLRSRAQTQ
jgi:ABC-type phosphate transport system substrate-binding protein